MAKKKKRKKQEIDVLKIIGLKSEKELNKIIHKGLDDPAVINLVKLGAKQHLRLLQLVREYVDVLALQLNVPTKDDVANVAKVALQIEEKLDCLEDKMLEIGTEKKMCEQSKKNVENRKVEKSELREILQKNLTRLNQGSLNQDIQKVLEKHLGRRR